MKMCLGSGRVHSAFAPRCWPVRKRCYQCGAARDDLPVSSTGKGNGKIDVAVGPLGRKPPPTAGNVPPTTRRPQVVPPRGPVQGLEVLQLPRLLLRLPLKNWSRHSSSSRVSCHLKTSPSMRRNWCHQNSKNVLSSVKESFLRLLKGKPIMRNRSRSILK